MTEKIGVLGGSFNPVHTGHLILAQDALEHFALKKVLLMPCANPPHKPAGFLASAAHRVAMLQLAVKDNPCLVVSTLEIERGGTSYTIDTLRQLRAMNPSARYVFIIGGDSLLELHTWREMDALLELCEIATLRRPGFEPAPRPETLRLPAPWPEKLLRNIFPGHQIEISATDIRRRAAQGLSLRYFVPFSVETYIVHHQLYKTGGT